ncbi:hypothetical protein BDB00DRAFT_787979 [Zychaea mexicana]|uniref:uncharacterized protein n=1 Tax=Zychaea mexicana TaxID=64656 RepID=UPI0022FEE43A|nr:uncharacterized protein BDB00DRAFT_787979 [Zychaea mexicana]KAI9493494.1 hypothetical protein BDB00DRAFT_787979 [Zychaea mexicana]
MIPSISPSEMLYTVIEENPHQCAMRIRYHLLEREILPELIVRITVTFCSDEIVFLNGVFHDSPSWFMIQSANSISHFMKVKGRMFAEIERSRIEDNTVQLAMAIRALAGLVGYMGIKLNDVEIGKCLELLQTTKTERIVKLLLSLILLSSEHAIRLQSRKVGKNMPKYQMNNGGMDVEKRTLAGVLSQLLQTGVSEMPMLLMVYFQTDQFGQIEAMARSILDMNVAIPKLALFEMQKLFRSIDTN